MSTPDERRARSKVPTQPRMLLAQERRDRALDLRIAGMSERAIAKELGISNNRAHGLLEEADAQLKGSCLEKAAQVRRIELERLDKLTAALFAQRQNPRAADSLLRIMERRAKLLGLDAPTRQEIAGPDQGPIAVKHDLTKLTVEELAELDAMLAKTEGAE